MMYHVVKLVRFTVKKEAGKVETLGRVGVRLCEFRKVGQEPLESKKGPKGPKKIFKIFKIQNFEKIFGPFWPLFGL